MIQRILDFGVRGLFGGARRGQPVLTALSAGAALVAYLVQHRRPRKERLYGHNLKEGETIQISFLKGETVVEAREVEG